MRQCIKYTDNNGTPGRTKKSSSNKTAVLLHSTVPPDNDTVPYHNGTVPSETIHWNQGVSSLYNVFLRLTY